MQEMWTWRRLPLVAALFACLLMGRDLADRSIETAGRWRLAVILTDGGKDLAFEVHLGGAPAAQSLDFGTFRFLTVAAQ